ncbi:hypothetical protein [Geodermatophilus amargosae]|uniref:hypothetical protein n=1 Tax=Geodermatophilus amargosae TaxID=1296565 RepID=UPI0034E00B7A
MVLMHRDGQAPRLFDLLAAGLPYGTYTSDDTGLIKGVYYRPLLEYARTQYGLGGEVHPQLSLDEVLRRLSVGASFVMVSVHKDIRHPERLPPLRGGHLVLVVGHDAARRTLHFRNPSGHTPETRAAELSIPTFARFFAERGVTLTLRP